MPINKAYGGPTNPAAGVIMTRPVTTPLQNAIAEYFLVFKYTQNTHVNEDAAAQIFVVTIAAAALPFAALADPPLKPFHPNHNNKVPNNTFAGELGSTFCFFISVFFLYFLVTTKTNANAAAPEEM
eukprot:NODE_70_length_24940_cov_0.663138.p23 type:complete len:126 gc:universal NODE_70_length_24940_cov_0.663138:956-579(-)